MLNPRSIDNPVSSWGSVEKSTNASGVTFDVKFMGYVPIPNSISNRPHREKDRIVKACVQSVVSSQISDDFRQLLTEETVQPFYSVDRLKVFLNIANYTITFFHIQERSNRSLLLGKYRNDKISHYKTVIVNGKCYIGIVMVKGHEAQELRECNVLELQSEQGNMEITRKLESINQCAHEPGTTLEARLRSTREYAYSLEMIPFYHRTITHEQAIPRLRRPGDFLLRDMHVPEGNKCAVSFLTSSGNPEKHAYDYALFLERWQKPNGYFIYPVLRHTDERL